MANDGKQLAEAASEILEQTGQIALATSVGDKPDVRVMDCCHDATHPDTIYILTDTDSPKTRQFAANDRVAVMSIPDGAPGFVRSSDAHVRKSARSMDDPVLHDALCSQIKGFEKTREEKGDGMTMYEIVMETAFVAGPGAEGTITY